MPSDNPEEKKYKIYKPPKWLKPTPPPKPAGDAESDPLLAARKDIPTQPATARNFQTGAAASSLAASPHTPVYVPQPKVRSARC